MSNRYLWFNIGQKGMHNVTWHCAIIKDDFDPSTILFEDCEWDENGNPTTVWVHKDEMDCKMHHSVEMSFEDLDKVAEWVKESYEIEEDVYVGDNNWLHIHDLFDMDRTNEYGVGLAVWD